MLRRSRKSLLQLAVFCIAVYLIVSLLRPSAPKLYSWNTIRYKTTAASLPEARGTCPGLEDSSKPVLIVSHVAADGDTAWLQHLSSKYHLCIYEVDAPADPTVDQLRVPANRGHESITYLTFLIDNYNHIPQAGAVFVHGSRFQWHNDDPLYDNAASLAALNIPSALAVTGYHNLRCDWTAGTCPKDSPPQGSLETSFNSILQPWSARSASDAAMPQAFAVLFGGDDYLNHGKKKGLKLGRNHPVRAQCCAQFVVSRESIQRHSREEYVALRQWLLDGVAMPRNFNNAAPRDDKIAGRVLSYLWHVLFIPHQDGPVDLDTLNAQACPSASDCYCRLYGKCDLQCNTGACYAQYRLPPNMRLPDNWAELHANDVYNVYEPGVKALHGRLYPKAFEP